MDTSEYIIFRCDAAHQHLPVVETEPAVQISLQLKLRILRVERSDHTRKNTVIGVKIWAEFSEVKFNEVISQMLLSAGPLGTV